MKKQLQKLWQDESAQGATEYILMLVIVVGVAMMFKERIMSILQSKMGSLGDQIGSFR